MDPRFVTHVDATIFAMFSVVSPSMTVRTHPDTTGVEGSGWVVVHPPRSTTDPSISAMSLVEKRVFIGPPRCAMFSEKNG